MEGLDLHCSINCFSSSSFVASIILTWGGGVEGFRSGVSNSENGKKEMRASSLHCNWLDFDSVRHHLKGVGSGPDVSLGYYEHGPPVLTLLSCALTTSCCECLLCLHVVLLFERFEKNNFDMKYWNRKGKRWKEEKNLNFKEKYHWIDIRQLAICLSRSIP